MPDNIIDVTDATFDAVVVEGSRRRPVLVDYWADWCGPCKMQMPVLHKLADAFSGAFLVAKVNTDVERQLTGRQGIRSLPTLHLYRNGEVVDEALGAQTETALRAMLEPWLERASDRNLALAGELIEQNKPELALESLRAGYTNDPANHRLAAEYARLCIQLGELDTAHAVMDAIPLEMRDKPEVNGLSTLLEFAQVTADAPPIEILQDLLRANPADTGSRFRLAARQALTGNYVSAADNLMEVVRAQPAFADGAAKRGLLGIFAMLGDDERVAQYRRKLALLLY